MNFYTNVVKSGNNLLVRGYENGRAFSRKVPYSPTLFINSKIGESGWKGIYGEQLEPMQFGSMREAYDMIKRYDGVSNMAIYGLTRFEYTYINDEYHGEINFDRTMIRIYNLDIEVSSANGMPDPVAAVEPVTAITLKKGGTYHVYSTVNYKAHRPNITYHKCRDEQELLRAFIHGWSDGGYPDVVTGWNIGFFDIIYLVNRITRVLGTDHAKQLSPWKFFSERNFVLMGREQKSIALAGIATIDYLEAYKKFVIEPRENYKLNTIAYVELEEEKLDYSEYDSLHDLYQNNSQKYIEYNVKDVELVERLDDKLGLLDLVFTLAYDAKVNYIDVFAQVRMWDVIIHNHLWQKKIALPNNEKHSKKESYEGAYVKEPVPNKYKWVMSFDLDSMYPHLIMQYNISPDTIMDIHVPNISVEKILLGNGPDLDKLSRFDGIIAPNGATFTNKFRGFLPELMETKYDRRKMYKRKQLDAEQLKEQTDDQYEIKKLEKDISRYKNAQKAMKVQLVSAYGAIGNQFFRFFDVRQAEAITIGGQLSIRWAEKKLNQYMNRICKTHDIDYIIASDTDSVYINMEPLVKLVFAGENPSDAKVSKFLDRLADEKIEPEIERFYEELKNICNGYSQKMNMKREVIASSGVWTGKKRYALDVINSEGVQYKEPKLKIMGLEAIRSSTPEVCRDAIEEAIEIILRKDEAALQEYIVQFREKFNKMKFEEVAFPRGVQGMDTYTLNSKSVPIHVRGSLIYNKLLNDKNLLKKYEPIKEGDKIKFCYMKVPNPTGNNILAVINTLPPEFAMERYIDYKTQFEKTFLYPIRNILDVIGWKEEPINTLEDFFT